MWQRFLSQTQQHVFSFAPPATAGFQLPPYVNQQHSQDGHSESPGHQELALYAKTDSSEIRQLETFNSSAQDAQTEPCCIL